MKKYHEGIAVHSSDQRELIIMPNGQTYEEYLSNPRIESSTNTHVVTDKQTEKLLKLMNNKDILASGVSEAMTKIKETRWSKENIIEGVTLPIIITGWDENGIVVKHHWSNDSHVFTQEVFIELIKRNLMNVGNIYVVAMG